MPYQCTFCTETFKTKHDWQRHEKSLHLPLEKWVCALHGPCASKVEAGEPCCVFCGATSPDNAHIESHHYSLCQERSLDERTFHRKDHLVQHLRLVHQAKFEAWSMKSWMIPMPDINSRCGFCGLEMTTWVERTDHLADHFKIGATMAEWKGDWGFDESTRRLVESAVPPCTFHNCTCADPMLTWLSDFIHYERNTLVPMRASDPPWGSPPNGYELIKIELEFFIQNYVDTYGRLPSNDEIQVEACRIIFAANSAPDEDQPSVPTVSRASWLRDLIMSSAELTRRAQFGPIRTSLESRHSPLKINGKDHLFEDCPFEAQLRAYVVEQQASGTILDDGRLQTQMCEVVRQMEKISMTPADMCANWIVKCICSSTQWMYGFKQRACVTTATEHQIAASDLYLQGAHSDWTQIASESLSQFNAGQSQVFTQHEGLPPVVNEPPPLMNSTSIHMSPTTTTDAPIVPFTRTTIFDMHGRPKGYPPDDTNFFRIFESDIKRWVAATMSPKNPNCHIPSDLEIQHQARWIMYDGDDPWNNTPADYAEWLWRFKEEMGIAHDDGAIMPTGSM
jgi:hypothetical protein